MSETPSPRNAGLSRTVPAAELDVEIAPEVDLSRRIDTDDWYWLPQPAQVDLLLYADGPIQFTGGSFDGLDRVIDAVDNDPWFWVDFEVTTAHRQSDPSADMTNRTFENIPLEDYDQLWLFGFDPGTSLLSPAEVSAIESFMNDHHGGVLTTGDHGNLGRGLSGDIERVGAMREYPAPPANVRGGRPNNPSNTTIRDANMDGRHTNPEQSDATPQSIRVRQYGLWSAVPSLLRYSQPHPVLCGPNGPIDDFPDHQHEGEIRIPGSYPSDEWPSEAGHQPRVEPIAWGEIVDPNATRTGQEFPIVGVYDGHRADVGRIVADSTWHHWFDINLDGFARNAPDVFDQLQAYFRNVAVWLAPPTAQRRMRNALTWGNFWFDPLVMLDPVEADPFRLGGTARDAFGRFAPQCTITDWVHLAFPPELRVAIDELRAEPPELGPEPPFPIEELVLGETIRRLSEEFGEADQAVEFPGHEPLDEVYAGAAERAVGMLADYQERATDRLAELSEVA
jgi:hypothetical protein